MTGPSFSNRLREALRDADEAVQWIVANHPKVMRELPLPLYQGLRRAAAVAGPQTKEQE